MAFVTSLKSRAVGLISLASAAACVLPFAACAPESPPTPGPEAHCADSCVAKAHACTADECARGCRLVLDKLVEHEGARVVACVAASAKARAKTKAKACDDVTFAECAARTGPFADGGPAPPRPPSDDDSL